MADIKNKIIIKSDDDLKIYNDNINYKVIAGPGAGKTYLVIENIKKIVEKSKRLSDDRKICCITYTNVAVDEIKSRLGDYISYTHVSTIHSFLNEYVIKPFSEQLAILLNEIFDIKIDRKKRFSVRQEGFSLLFNYKLEEVNSVLEEKGINTYLVRDKSYYEAINFDYNKISIDKIFSKESIKWKFKDFDKASYKDIFDDKEKYIIKHTILEKYRVLDFDDSLFFSLLLALRFPHIARYLRYTFPYVIIDEYQDTVSIQNKFVQRVFDNAAVTLLVVGDPAQAIYGFAGADYREFYDFNTVNKPMQECVIQGNRRSGENIVAFLNYIREKDEYLPEQYVVNPDLKDKGQVVFILNDNYKSNGEEKLDIMKIIDDEVNVLTRRWTDAFLYLDGISYKQRDNIKKIHSYWSYNIGRDLFLDFEKGDGRWISQIIFISKVLRAINEHDFYTILQECNKIFDLQNFEEGKMKTEDVKKLFKFIGEIEEIKHVDNYGNMIKEINRIARESGLQIFNEFEYVEKSNEKRYVNFYKYLNDLDLDSIDLIVNKVFIKNGKYTSIHKTKGKEYMSVFTDFEVTNWENHFDIFMLTEREMFKDYASNSKEVKSMCENLRIAYVASSRAIKNLYINIKADEQEFACLQNNMDNYIKRKNIGKFYVVKKVSELKKEQK